MVPVYGRHARTVRGIYDRSTRAECAKWMDFPTDPRRDPRTTVETIGGGFTCPNEMAVAVAAAIARPGLDSQAAEGQPRLSRLISP
jgi:hypothetical protein